MKKAIDTIVAVTVLLMGPALISGSEIEELRSAVEATEWTNAKALGESLTAADQEGGEAFYLLGKAYVGLGEHEAAVAALKKANTIVEDNADYLADYGYALILRGQEMNMFQAGPVYMRAMDQYKAAVKADPDHLASHIGLSRYYMNAPAIGGGSMKKSKDHAAEIARINPYLGHIEHAMIAQKESRNEEAEAEFAAAIAMKSDEAWVYFELAKLQQMVGKMQDAKSSYEKVLALDPSHEGAKAALSAF
ncbi:tetratricopeptide repeat protein [Pelagicoccus sp. SDUM812002]|uniref:tetratricopeptide repeat protein n=1 Tax=Pelagicoccus sp. SDUM812002 TaxID=3041266 RepID=UPI00280FDC14|nr:tetratricopeptide repeat protein [Pelagicoccus sp. SDUM812002]MDQ8185651.1 tetratricopeptide repeat protein [Pelagicoccus sp. SDUM812002]